MELYLIRHTSVKHAEGLCYGQTDLAVSDNFANEAALIRNCITDPDDIFAISSPLGRCTKLSSYLFSSFIRDDRLMEMNFGNWENRSWNSIDKIELDTWGADWIKNRVPDGESYTDVVTRSFELLLECFLLPHKRIALITHKGVVIALESIINGKGPAEAFKNDSIPYGYVARYEINKAQEQIIRSFVL